MKSSIWELLILVRRESQIIIKRQHRMFLLIDDGYTHTCPFQRKEKRIWEHINSFPRMPSHYCRSNTKKRIPRARTYAVQDVQFIYWKMSGSISCPCKVSFIQKHFQHWIQFRFSRPKERQVRYLYGIWRTKIRKHLEWTTTAVI